MKPDNKIQIHVITTGSDLVEEFNIHQPLHVVKERALQGEQPGADPKLFHLEYEEQTLDENKKISEYIEEYGWTDGVQLELVSQPTVI